MTADIIKSYCGRGSLGIPFVQQTLAKAEVLNFFYSVLLTEASVASLRWVTAVSISMKV